MRRNKPDNYIKIAKERIQLLSIEAKKMAKSDPELAKRYINLLRKIGMRFNVKIPKEIRRKYCKFCHNYLLKYKQRTKNSMIHITCSYCKKIYRIPFPEE